ncbi:glycosyltransferase [Geomonas sp.]|uniref:glycosyltransferase n=1 Tax=Geomonas sp. TaxID=2651584 RepID=UPI002B48D8FB|nr:glycosyltransferase [Geomonas sp.]HJV36042.1 glycosyltransferase [Geomonas sp.]
MSKPHILFVPSWYPTAATPLLGIFFQEQAHALRDAGHRVGVVYADIRSPKFLSVEQLIKGHFQTTFQREEGIDVVRFHGWHPPKARRLGTQLYRLATARIVGSYIRRFGRPDLLHAQGTLWGGVAACEAARRYRIPYLVTEHSSVFSRKLVSAWETPYLERVLASAASVLTVSGSLARELAGYRGGGEIRVVPNAVDTSFFAPFEGSKPRTPFVFLSVANLNPNKGTDLLLKAFARSFSGRTDVALEVGGDGPQRRSLEELAAALGISPQVRFLGALSREQVRQAMWRASVLVVSSHVETFGVVAIEAMATGLPVIATRCGGPEEIVVPGTGLLVEAGSVESLAGAMENVCQGAPFDPRHIRSYAVENFGRERLVERLALVYQQIQAAC